MEKLSASVDSSELARYIKDGLRELDTFSRTPEFQALLEDLWSLPLEQRADFVANVILDPDQLAMRKIRIPEKIKIQRSAFRDNRPTLFCIVRYIPDGLQWSKVTITYDNPSGEPALPYPIVAKRFEQEVATKTQL